MHRFQLEGLPSATFAPLFELSDAELLGRGAVRRIADSTPGFPCRVSLRDAELGEELLLLPHEHHPSSSPYRASGPIFVRRNAHAPSLEPGEVPPYVTTRVISLRAYDAAGFMVAADVRPGQAVADWLEDAFTEPAVAYVHLHNAKQGCFSCAARRAR